VRSSSGDRAQNSSHSPPARPARTQDRVIQVPDLQLHGCNLRVEPAQRLVVREVRVHVVHDVELRRVERVRLVAQDGLDGGLHARRQALRD
jgi:hypothetical protein